MGAGGKPAPILGLMFIKLHVESKTRHTFAPDAFRR